MSIEIKNELNYCLEQLNTFKVIQNNLLYGYTKIIREISQKYLQNYERFQQKQRYSISHSSLSSLSSSTLISTNSFEINSIIMITKQVNELISLLLNNETNQRSKQENNNNNNNNKEILTLYNFYNLHNYFFILNFDQFLIFINQFNQMNFDSECNNGEYNNEKSDNQVIFKISSLYSYILDFCLNDSNQCFFSIFISNLLIKYELTSFPISFELHEFQQNNILTDFFDEHSLVHVLLNLITNKWKQFYEFCDSEDEINTIQNSTNNNDNSILSIDSILIQDSDLSINLPPISNHNHNHNHNDINDINNTNIVTLVDNNTNSNNVNNSMEDSTFSKHSLICQLKQEVCGICLQDEFSQSDITVLCCGSIYHFSCLLQWFKTQFEQHFSQMTCPTCRKVIHLISPQCHTQSRSSTLNLLRQTNIFPSFLTSRDQSSERYHSSSSEASSFYFDEDDDDDDDNSDDSDDSDDTESVESIWVNDDNDNSEDSDEEENDGNEIYHRVHVQSDSIFGENSESTYDHSIRLQRNSLQLENQLIEIDLFEPYDSHSSEEYRMGLRIPSPSSFEVLSTIPDENTIQLTSLPPINSFSRNSSQSTNSNGSNTQDISNSQNSVQCCSCNNVMSDGDINCCNHCCSLCCVNQPLFCPAHYIFHQFQIQTNSSQERFVYNQNNSDDDDDDNDDDDESSCEGNEESESDEESNEEENKEEEGMIENFDLFEQTSQLQRMLREEFS